MISQELSALLPPIEPPSLPSLPIRAVGSAGLGYLWAKIASADASLAAKAFAIESLADNLLFHLVNLPFGTSQKRSQIIYACTNTVTQIVSIVAFRQLNLIGSPGTKILTASVLGWIAYSTIVLLRVNDQPTQNTPTNPAHLTEINP